MIFFFFFPICGVRASAPAREPSKVQEPRRARRPLTGGGGLRHPAVPRRVRVACLVVHQVRPHGRVVDGHHGRRRRPLTGRHHHGWRRRRRLAAGRRRHHHHRRRHHGRRGHGGRHLRLLQGLLFQVDDAAAIHGPRVAGGYRASRARRRSPLRLPAATPSCALSVRVRLRAARRLLRRSSGLRRSPARSR
ncbi:unnamed protein product, partial [Ixodes pacificus]